MARSMVSPGHVLIQALSMAVRRRGFSFDRPATGARRHGDFADYLGENPATLASCTPCGGA
jgi:hypothetical protein